MTALFERGMSPRPFLLVLALSARALASSTDQAFALYKDGKFADARKALEAVVATEPQNARACFCLGRCIMATERSQQGLDEAVPWLEKAAKFAPSDPEILAAYGEVCMQEAGIHISIPTALRGRDAIEAALAINPNDLVAKKTLYQFYEQAPWPIGSSSKAAIQLEAIRARDPDRAALITISTQIRVKDYAGAFKTCEGLFAKNPDSTFALIQYGRVAAISGQNLDRGLAYLKRFVALAPSAPKDPRLANAWGRIGNIYEKLGNVDGARAAYQKMLQLEPGNKSAAAALAKLKQ